jgi:hypothetical protein
VVGCPRVVIGVLLTVEARGPAAAKYIDRFLYVN